SSWRRRESKALRSAMYGSLLCRWFDTSSLPGMRRSTRMWNRRPRVRCRRSSSIPTRQLTMRAWNLSSLSAIFRTRASSAGECGRLRTVIWRGTFMARLFKDTVVRPRSTILRQERSRADRPAADLAPEIIMMDVSGRHYLTPLFEPASVAIVGASEVPGKVGTMLFSNMLAAGYRGGLYAVNPKYPSVSGVACYPSVAKVPAPVDLAVIATPARTVPGVIDECGRAGVRSAVVITAGFAEVGAEGAKLERALLENARRWGVRLVGP